LRGKFTVYIKFRLKTRVSLFYCHGYGAGKDKAEAKSSKLKIYFYKQRTETGTGKTAKHIVTYTSIDQDILNRSKLNTDTNEPNQVIQKKVINNTQVMKII